MEAPGLDLGGSGLDFRRFWTSQTMPEGFSWVANALPPTCPASLGRSKAKSDRDVAKSQDVCLECLCSRVLAAMGEVLTEWGGRRCPPPGGFQLNPPHPPKAGWRMGFFCTSAVPGGFWLCQGPCAFRRSRSKVSIENDSGHFFRFFGLPKNALKFVSKK